MLIQQHLLLQKEELHEKRTSSDEQLEFKLDLLNVRLLNAANILIITY